MFTRVIKDPTRNPLFQKKVAILSALAIVLSILLIPGIGMSVPGPSVTAPADRYISPGVANQNPGSFVLSDFPSETLVVNVELVNPPSGTNFSISSTSGLTLRAGYASWVGQTSVSFTGTQTDANLALASIVVSAGATTGSAALKVTAQTLSQVGSASFNAENGHYYEFVSSSGILWTAAKTAAEGRTFNGVNGYLVTITSATENTFVKEKIAGAINVWIGASDSASEGIWKWATGPEGLANTLLSTFQNWASGEPNDFGSGEDYAVTNWGSADGKWNDLPDSAPAIAGYVVEYSSWNGQTLTVVASAEATLTVDGTVLVPGNAQLRVEWPTSSTQTVSRSVIRVSPGGQIVTLTSTRDNYRITGLTNGTEYSVEVEIEYTDSSVFTWPAVASTPIDSAPSFTGPVTLTADQGQPATAGTFRIDDNFNCGWGEMTATVRSSLSDTKLSVTLSGSVTSTGDRTATLVLTGTRTELNTVLSTLIVETPGSADFTVTTEVVPSIRFSATENGVTATYHLNRSNGHYYRVVSEAVTREVARVAATQMNFCGSAGYLVAIDDAAEQTFIESEALTGSGDLWTSGLYSGSAWNWEPGENAGSSDSLAFYNTGSSLGSGPWHTGEPNASGLYHQLWDKVGVGYGWDDVGDSPRKYLVEFGSNNSFAVPAVVTAVSVTPDPSISSPASPQPTATPSPTASTGPASSPSQPRNSPTTAPTPPPAPLAGPAVLSPPTNGGTVATVGGEPVDPETSSKGNRELDVNVGDIDLTFKVPNGSGGIQDKNGKPQLDVKRDQDVNLTGGGLLPGSTVQVWLPGTSVGKELGRIPVGDDGEFDGEVSFAANSSGAPLPIGEQVIQLTGVDANGDQTVLNMTINISQPDLSPELFRGQTVTPKPGFGNFEASNAGLPELANLTAFGDQKQAVVEGNGWSLSLQLTESGSGITENADGIFITVVRGETASFGGQGFMPESTASLWLFSEPMLLGEVFVNTDGSFSGSTSAISELIAAGEHTIQIQGVGQDGFIRSANLGIVIAEPALAAGAVPLIVWLPLTLVGLLIAGGIFFVVAARRRKRADGSNVIQFPQAA